MSETHSKNHDYHLVDPSPWPAIGAIAAFITAIGAVIYFHQGSYWLLIIGLIAVLYTMYGWWREVIKEANKGDHTPVVQLHLRYGMIMFIASEVMFFVAWFWSYFDASLYAGETQQYLRTELTGGHWPPDQIATFDPWHLPLLNTLILLTSGTAVTWAHHSLLHDDRRGLRLGLLVTVALGAIFTCVQAYEYTHAAFDFSGHIYGATFFMATGFHGFHVLVGTIFLIVCTLRVGAGHFKKEQHFGFEAAAWYLSLIHI